MQLAEQVKGLSLELCGEAWSGPFGYNGSSSRGRSAGRLREQRQQQLSSEEVGTSKSTVRDDAARGKEATPATPAAYTGSGPNNATAPPPATHAEATTSPHAEHASTQQPAELLGDAG